MAPGLDLTFLSREITDSKASTLHHQPFLLATATQCAGSKVQDPSEIPTDFDLLRFEGAAFNQLHVEDADDAKDAKPTSTLLISSPYNSEGHFLDLTTLSTPFLLFAKALTALKPVRPDYATAEYTKALNFPAILDLLRDFATQAKYDWKSQTFYVVVFRSKLKEGIDSQLLYRLDCESHREACESGGLLKYWFGAPDAERRNLATCE